MSIKIIVAIKFIIHSHALPDSINKTPLVVAVASHWQYASIDAAGPGTVIIVFRMRMRMRLRFTMAVLNVNVDNRRGATDRLLTFI